MKVVILAGGLGARVFEESHLELGLRDAFLRIKSLPGGVGCDRDAVTTLSLLTSRTTIR